MVQLAEIEGMFWGTVVGAGKKYSLPVEKSFNITMAALDVQQTKDSEPVSLVLKRNDVEYILCTLAKGSVFQQKLDLMFEMGEDIELFARGNGVVHLTGYFIGEQDFDDEDGFDQCEDDEEEFDDDMDMMDMDDDEEEEEEEKEVVVKGKRKKVEVAAAPAKKAKVEEKKPAQVDNKKADNKKQENKKQDNKQNNQNKNNNQQQKKPEQPKSVPATPEGGKKKKNKKNKNKKNKSNN